MYGENRNTATHPELPVLTERPDGFEFDLSQNVPATDLDVFFGCRMGPRHFQTLDDTDGDNVPDMRLTTVLLPLDRDGDGILERDGDGALLRVVGAEVIEPGMQAQCCPVVRRRTAGRVLHQLSGVGRSMPTSIMDPRARR